MKAEDTDAKISESTAPFVPHVRWAENQKRAIKNRALEVAQDVMRFRQVLIVTVDHSGIMQCVEAKAPGVTLQERAHIYRELLRGTGQAINDERR